MHSDTIGHASIYHGDALKVLEALPDACADAVLVDPPYASGGATLSAKQHKTSEKYQTTGTKKDLSRVPWRQYGPAIMDALYA